MHRAKSSLTISYLVVKVVWVCVCFYGRKVLEKQFRLTRLSNLLLRNIWNVHTHPTPSPPPPSPEPEIFLLTEIGWTIEYMVGNDLVGAATSCILIVKTNDEEFYIIPVNLIAKSFPLSRKMWQEFSEVTTNSDIALSNQRNQKEVFQGITIYLPQMSGFILI